MPQIKDIKASNVPPKINEMNAPHMAYIEKRLIDRHSLVSDSLKVGISG